MKLLFIPSILLIIFFTMKVLSDKRDYFTDSFNLHSEPLVKKPMGFIKCKNNTKFKSRGAVCTSEYVPATDEELAKR